MAQPIAGLNTLSAAGTSSGIPCDPTARVTNATTDGAEIVDPGRYDSTPDKRS